MNNNEEAMKAALKVLKDSPEFNDVQRQAIANAIKAALDKVTWVLDRQI